MVLVPLPPTLFPDPVDTRDNELDELDSQSQSILQNVGPSGVGDSVPNSNNNVSSECSNENILGNENVNVNLSNESNLSKENSNLSNESTLSNESGNLRNDSGLGAVPPLSGEFAASDASDAIAEDDSLSLDSEMLDPSSSRKRSADELLSDDGSDSSVVRRPVAQTNNRGNRKVTRGHLPGGVAAAASLAASPVSVASLRS